MSAIPPSAAGPMITASAPAATRSAQAAFFRAALEQTAGRTAQPGPGTPAQPEAAPRPQRPGALLDIRV